MKSQASPHSWTPPSSKGIPRTQVIPFTVLGGQTLDMSACTKFNHSKVKGVVLLPDKNIFGDRVYLEINGETVLPYGFNAGLISFRQFLNREMRSNVHYFEEWAAGSKIRVIYTNNDKRSVNIELLLLTVLDDHADITERIKLQLVPVPYTASPGRLDNTYEPCEVRTKTDFYYDELIGIFNDRFNYVQTVYDSFLATGEAGAAIRDFLMLYGLPPANTAEEKKAKKAAATSLQERIKKIAYIPPEAKALTDAVKNSLADYLEDKTPETPEPDIAQKDLFALQESVESFTVYDDNHKGMSTLEVIVGERPFYPDGYPIAGIVPRYRKSFNETMYRTSMPVKEADVFIRFAHREAASEKIYIPADFSVYFMYRQKVRS